MRERERGGRVSLESGPGGWGPPSDDRKDLKVLAAGNVELRSKMAEGSGLGLMRGAPVDDEAALFVSDACAGIMGGRYTRANFGAVDVLMQALGDKSVPSLERRLSVRGSGRRRRRRRRGRVFGLWRRVTWKGDFLT